MRILHTANTYAPLLDGVAEVVRHVSEECALRGHEVHVATRQVSSQPSEATINGVHLHRFAACGSLADGMRGEIARYADFVKSGNWDVMVNHCLQTWATDALLGSLERFPWPSILVTHGMSGLSIGNNELARYYDRIPAYIPSYANWVSVSALGEEFTFARNHLLPAPVVIRNGVDLAEWSTPPLRLRSKERIGDQAWVVNVSNHCSQKGHAAFYKLAESLKGHAIKFTLIGGEHLAQRWGLGRLGIRGGCYYKCRLRSTLSRTVELRISLPRAQVISAIQEADVIVSTSEWEANSVVLLESMAAGTPWVSMDVGSARELTGGVVVRSLDEMSTTVTQLLKDRGRRKALGIEGRGRALSTHDWKTVVSEYERMYYRVCGSRDAQRPVTESGVPL